MDEQNPYQAPNSDLREPTSRQDYELADPLIRWLARIVDGFFLLILLLPVMWFGGYFQSIMQNQMGMAFLVQWTAVTIGAYVLLQGLPLYTWGQTWGKRLLDIRIVDLEYRQPSFANLLVHRHVVPVLLSSVPVLGILFYIANPLFIFSEDRRCLHDRIAGTRVINVNRRT